jgi:hypothetical protein
MLAHVVDGGALPAPPWLLGYLGVALVLGTAAALRATWPRARGAAAEPVATRLEVGAGHVAGTLLYAGAIALCFAGPGSTSQSFAYWFVVVVWWVGLPIACLLAGDVFRVVNPFVLPAAVLRRGRGDSPGPTWSGPTWTGAAFLAAWSWYVLAYHDRSPTSLGVLLVTYAGLAVAGGVVWGPTWLHAGEAFGAISAAVGRVGARSRARTAPVAGAALVATVWVGATAFDGFTYSELWADVLGTSRGWTSTTLNTVGLVWMTAMVGAGLLAVARVAERGQRERDAGRQLTHPLGWAFVPLAVGWSLGHDLTLLLAEGQSAYALASDPLGRGWDLFGTITYTIDYAIVSEAWVAWTQVALIAAGHVGSVVLLHELALERLPARAAMRATWSMAAVASASITAAALLVLA